MTILDLYKRTVNGSWTETGLEVWWRIEQDSDCTRLFFQGTTTWKQWLKDFDFPAIPYKNQSIKWWAHRGFVEMWKSARDYLVPYVISAMGSKPLVISGYSLGASLAVLAHEDIGFTLAAQGMDPTGRVSTTAFAPARVLWLPSREILDRFAEVTCYRNHGDPVPMSPPWVWGYSHVGDMNYIGEKKIVWPTNHLVPAYEKALGTSV